MKYKNHNNNTPHYYLLVLPNMQTQTTVSSPTAIPSKPVRDSHTITIPHMIMGLNQVLAKLHHSILPKCGRVIVKCPNLKCFPKDTPDGIRKAKELGEKWSDSFQNRRWNNDFKSAGLWTRFFFDTKKRLIKITVEPKRFVTTPRVSIVDTTTDSVPVIDEPTKDMLNDAFIESDDEDSHVAEHTSDQKSYDQESYDQESYDQESYDQEYDDESHVQNQVPMVPTWTMTPYGWMMTPQPWNPRGWQFVHPQMMSFSQVPSQL